MTRALVAIAVSAALSAACGSREEDSEVSSSAGPGTRADLVLTGGRVWTSGDNDSAGEPTAIAVRGGRIAAVGSDAHIEEWVGPGTRRVALSGRRVIPGLMDNHTHFLDGGFELSGVQLRDADTPTEFARRIGRFASDHPGEWMTGGQWDHELWGGALPHRDWIDSLTAETPVFVQRLDGHMGLANSRALEAAGINASTPDPDGGTIVRDEDGRATGVLKDAAQAFAFERMPPPSEDELDRALAAAARHAVERGVTLITDMGTWAGFETYRRARARGSLPLRVYAVVPLATWERMRDLLADEGRGDHRLFWGGLKAYVDGSLGSTTAWFYEPYEDAPDERGLMVTDTATLHEDILQADAAGMHVIVHAIGTRANDWLLDAFAEAERVNGPRDRRFRVEHAQHLRPDAIERFAAQGVVPSMQPYHAIDDGRWAINRIGPERIDLTYAFRDLLDSGAALTFGSDWTVAPLDPLLGIYAAVTRRTTDGRNPEGWVPRQKISVEEAVTAYTSANAYASYLESESGRIAPGFYADLVVLSDDIFTIDPIEIERVRVDLTFVEGELVFERESTS
jgi:predicted amidohydrolase YtcJ